MIEVILRPDVKALRLDAFSATLAVELAESVVGSIFEEEMDHVDISWQPYNSELEERTTPLLIKIILDGGDLHHDPAKLSEQFGEAWKPIWENDVVRPGLDTSFRVWVLPIPGGHLYEPRTRKDHTQHAPA